MKLDEKIRSLSNAAIKSNNCNELFHHLSKQALKNCCLKMKNDEKLGTEVSTGICTWNAVEVGLVEGEGPKIKVIKFQRAIIFLGIWTQE